MRDPIFDTFQGERFVVLARELREFTGTREDVDAIAWKVCHSREAADNWFFEFSQVYSFVHVRECGRELTLSQPSGPDVVGPLPVDRFEAGGVA